MQYDIFKFTEKELFLSKTDVIYILRIKKKLPTSVSTLNDTYFLHQHMSDNVMFVNIMSLYVYKK